MNRCANCGRLRPNPELLVVHELDRPGHVFYVCRPIAPDGRGEGLCFRHGVGGSWRHAIAQATRSPLRCRGSHESSD